MFRKILPTLNSLTSICRQINLGMVLFISLFFFIIPAAITIHDLSDPGIRSAAIPRSAWKLHQTLSPRFAQWAENRTNSKRPTQVSVDDISGTEWPLFGTAFYLWSTEALQDAWEKDHSSSRIAPNIYARRAIDAATSLVLDPTQANWVKIHWGEKYLTAMLLILLAQLFPKSRQMETHEN